MVTEHVIAKIEVSVLKIVQMLDHNMSHIQIYGRIDSYKLKNVIHSWQAGGCELKGFSALSSSALEMESPI